MQKAALIEARTWAPLVWKPVVLASYCVILAAVSYHHEPWFDEAQAWLLARDASVPDLFLTYLRDEGTPGLWHMLLMPLAKPGFPYWSVQLMAAASAILGAALILWLSPFPPLIRAILPFTYFLLYQYAVVARSYVLLAPLLAGIAWFLPQARLKPWTFIALLSLLANVSIHGTLAATGILLTFLLEVWRDSGLPKPRLSPGFLMACGVFVFVLALVAIEVWPPPKAHLLKDINTIGNFENAGSRIRNQVAEAFSFDLWVALVPLALSLIWMVRRRVALYFVLPAGLVLGFSSIVYGKPWHAGILFLLWLFAMWIATNRDPGTPPVYVWVAWALLLGMHVYWSARAGFQDIVAPYSGSRALAARISPDVAAGKRIAGVGFMCVAVQPYFRGNIFVNYHGGRKPAFWFRTPETYQDFSLSSALSQRPDLILVSLWQLDRPDRDHLVQSLADSGHAVSQEFPGAIIWKSGLLIDDSYLLARKTNE
jgi:hypothetical protein